MSSLRHNPEPDREPRDVYLDAARDCILDVGWRRTTLTEVARRARVSRMTIYRTWADMPTLLADLMTREWAAVVTAEVAAGQELPTGPERDTDMLTRLNISSGSTGTVEQIVAGITGTVHTLRQNELFVRIVELDPELILPYLFSRRGRSQDHILGLTAAAIGAGQQIGAVRRGNPVAMARALLLATHGFVLSMHTMVDEQASETELADELATLIRRTLQP